MRTMYFNTEMSPTLPNRLIRTFANTIGDESSKTPSIGDSHSGRVSVLSDVSVDSDLSDEIKKVSQTDNSLYTMINQ